MKMKTDAIKLRAMGAEQRRIVDHLTGSGKYWFLTIGGKEYRLGRKPAQTAESALKEAHRIAASLSPASKSTQTNQEAP
jgi:hypothetical protein